MHKIRSAAEALEYVRAAHTDCSPFEIVAGATRRNVGRPCCKPNGADLPGLDVSALSGIVKYEPEELVLSVLPSTPLTEISALLSENGQRLGFDPADWSEILGSKGAPTVGGALSCDASGSGRLRHGGARDSLLGFHAVNGLARSFRAGSRVVKNVTGFDLPKLVCGAFGTLCVLTELTFRVYPRPAYCVTLCLVDVTPEVGFSALRKIAHSALEPSGLAYLPGNMLDDIGQGAAFIRLEGAKEPLEDKVALAHGLLGKLIPCREDDARLFPAIGCGKFFAGVPGDVWRIMIVPSDAPHLVRRLESKKWLGDWAGGLIWVAAETSQADRVRQLAANFNGQAMLLRADARTRAEFGVYAAPSGPLAALNKSVKAAFDPKGLFNPGRFP